MEETVTDHEQRINDLDNSQTQLEEKVGGICQVMKEPFHSDVTIFAIGMPHYANGDDTQLARRILTAMGCGNTRFVGVMRTPARDNSKGVFKIELENKENKIAVLRRKASLKQSQEFKNVFVRSSMSHADRLTQLNFRTLLSEIPAGKDFRVANNGRIIKRTSEQKPSTPRYQPPTSRNADIRTPSNGIVKANLTSNGTNSINVKSPTGSHISPRMNYSSIVQGSNGQRSHNVHQTLHGYSSNQYQTTMQPQGMSFSQSQGMTTQMPYSTQTFQQNEHSQPYLSTNGLTSSQGQMSWTQQNQGDLSLNQC